MVGIVRAIALGLLVVAITVHIVGFATDNWVSVKVNINEIMYAFDMRLPLLNKGDAEINMGLRKICIKTNMDQLLELAMIWAGGDGDVDGVGVGSICINCLAVEYIPGWMGVVSCAGWKKAVEGLGVVSLIAAVAGVAAILYSCFGDGKGDYARLMPFIIAGICVVAGVLLLIGTAVYWAEFEAAIRSLMNKLDTEKSGSLHLAEILNVRYSFVLEAVAGVLMLLTSMVVAIPAIKGWDQLSAVQWSSQYGGVDLMAC